MYEVVNSSAMKTVYSSYARQFSNRPSSHGRCRLAILCPAVDNAWVPKIALRAAPHPVPLRPAALTSTRRTKTKDPRKGKLDAFNLVWRVHGHAGSHSAGR